MSVFFTDIGLRTQYFLLFGITPARLVFHPVGSPYSVHNMLELQAVGIAQFPLWFSIAFVEGTSNATGTEGRLSALVYIICGQLMLSERNSPRINGLRYSPSIFGRVRFPRNVTFGVSNEHQRVEHLRFLLLLCKPDLGVLVAQ